MIGDIIGEICYVLTRHRFDSWEPMVIPENKWLRFEHAACRYCRQWYVRPQRLEPLTPP